MKPKFKNGEEVYVLFDGERISEGFVMSFEWIEQHAHINAVTGQDSVATGYLYCIDGYAYKVMESLLRRKQQKYGSYDKMISEFKQPICKKSLTEQ